MNGNGVRDTSFAQGANPDIVFVFDVSLSTLSSFQGTPIGNQITNILQAEIAGITALNQQLIRQGLGETARVGIVSFAGDASSIDMNPSVSGIQLLTNPIADNDNNGILDFEQVLQGTNIRLGTNFEVALQESERVFKTIGTTPGNGTLVFLSDGQSFGGSITDEVNKLKALGIKLYAFGVGDGSTLNDGDGLDDDLITIDPNAKIFKNTDELLDTFNNLGGGQNVAEPALSGVQVYLDLNNNGVFETDEPSQLTNNQNSQVQTNSITVAATDAIFLAGRDDITIPPLGTNDPSFPLQRRRTVRPGSVPETFPQSIAVQNNEIFTFEASGSVNFSNGFSPFNPDGNSLRSTIAGLDGISAYNGRTGSLVGLFLNDENPENQTPPTDLSFQRIGSDFTFLTASIGQVFFIGDGRNSSNQAQQFAAPQGATRLFVGIADGSSLRPGNYEDNTGSYQVTIKSDRFGNDENYSFTGLLPGNYTVRQVVPNGYAQTFPTITTGNLGSYTVNLGAGDKVENLNFGNQNTTRPNRLPNFITAPPSNGQTGQLLRYEASATDPDGDVLTYKLLTKPTGMAIDSERGVLIWQPAADQLGNFNVALQVEDGKGGSATQTFQINVGDGVDRELPTVQFGFSSNIVNIGESVTFQVSGTDNNGIANIALTIDGNPVTLNAGSATVQLNKAGVFQVVATATDTTGNVVKKDLSLRVLDPSDTTAPTVEIISPQTNKTITNLTDIVGSINDNNLEFYRVDYAPLDLVDINNLAAVDPDFVTISEGKTNVNKTIIGQFDPTVLFNGNYVLRVTAQDFSGNISSRGVFLGVSGDNKVGNFRLELTDLSIPLAGIPIQINRVYDTLQSSFSGDFGFGWSLGVKDAKIQESVPLTDAEKQGVPSLFGANPFTAGTKVYLTNPEGRRVGFTFDPFIAGGSLLGAFWKPRFVADAGVYDKLEVDDINLQQRSDGSFSLFFIPFAYNPSEYKLTTKDGTTYEYDQFKGLQEVKDRNNNTLTFRDNGIFSSTGASVEFLRDTQGRITQIKDPTGKAILYGYDARGNLVSVTDQAGLVSRHTYLANPNYLEQIIDPRGKAVIRTEYDAKGRVKATKDALGNTISSDYDVSAGGSTLTQLDALGNTTTTIRDGRGNVTSVINPLGAVTKSNYDANNNPISITDPRGFTTTRKFDARGNTSSITDALGNTRSFTYDQFNNVTSETDPLGRITRFVYNTNGNLVELIDATGQPNRFAYDTLGRVSSFTDAKGNATTFGYTGTTLGKPTQVTFPDGSTQQIEYNQFGQISRLVDENGSATEYVTDDVGRLIVKRDALGNETKYTYDAQLISSVIDPLGNTVKFEYDNAGRLIRQIDPFNGVTEFGYDALGRRISETDPLGRTTTTTYREDGLIAAVTDGNGSTTSFEYDLAGNQTAVIDPLGNRTSFGYDALGRQIRKIDPLGNVGNYAYDAINNVIQITDRNNRQRTFTYDGVNRLVQENWLNNSTPSRTINFTYDAVGNLVRATDADSTFAFNYDSRDRVTQVNQTAVSGLAPVSLNYTYDGTGNRTSVSDNFGVGVNSTYDARNLLTSQTWQGTGIDPARVNYSYDSRGDRTQIQRFSNLAGTQLVGSSNFNYDALQRLTGITHSNGAGSTLANYSYNYNLASFLNSETYKGQTTNYTYDRANQLTNADRSLLPDENYTYDANGNPRGNGLVVGANNQILSDGQFNYTYDREGNLATKSNIATGVVTTYNYDFRNRLVGVVDRNLSGNTTQSVEFKYDAFDRRISKTVNGQTTYFVNDGDKLWAELNPAGEIISRYLQGADVDELIARYRPGEGTSWYLTDRLGTIRDMANAVGNLANSINYDSFGEILSQTNSNVGDRFTFAGREFDSETGLYYNRARYYDANLGRFISQDPIEFAGGDANLYRYVGNNPVNATDAFGFIAALEYSSILSETVSGRTGSVIGSLIGFLQGFGATNLVFISNILEIANAGGDPIAEWGNAIKRTEEKVKEINDNLSRLEALDNKEGLVKGFVTGAGYDLVKLEWKIFPDKVDRVAKFLGPELSVSESLGPVSGKLAPVTKKSASLSIKGGGFKQGYEAGLLYLQVIAAPN